MATILLSIKPEYANKIFDGQKHYEYRKRIPKKEVSKIVVYSSAPEQAVIGEVEVVKTLKMKPTPLWNSTKANAGISRSKYRKYFSGCTMAALSQILCKRRNVGKTEINILPAAAVNPLSPY